MAASDVEHIKQHVRVYVTVFLALMVLTGVTVAISYLQLPTVYAITLAMIVATIKAGLVASYFMHLISEEKVILWILLLCVAFLLALFVLPLSTEVGNGPLWPL